MCTIFNESAASTAPHNIVYSPSLPVCFTLVHVLDFIFHKDLAKYFYDMIMAFSIAIIALLN